MTSPCLTCSSVSHSQGNGQIDLVVVVFSYFLCDMWYGELVVFSYHVSDILWRFGCAFILLCFHTVKIKTVSNYQNRR